MNERSPLAFLSPASPGGRLRSVRYEPISRASFVAWGLLALPIVLFISTWATYAVNVPKWDDHALRAFLYYSEQETTLSGKIYQLFRQHNEHRIVYDRFITLLDYKLTGKLNFRHLMVVGNLSLVGLLLLFIAVLRQYNRPLLYAVPVAWLLFNLSQWENMFWGMAALQNFSVVLWVLAALYGLTYTNRWGLALLPALLATLTSGNGLLIWPIGFVLLTLRSGETSRLTTQWLFRPLVGWTLASVLIVGLYFVGFEKPDDIAYVRPGIVDLLKGWFAVTGAAAEALPLGQPLRNSMVLGGLMTLMSLGIIGWSLLAHRLTISRIGRRLISPDSVTPGSGTVFPAITLFFWGFAGFLLGTAAVVAWARTGFGADLLITSRYKIYSLSLLALLYVYAIITAGNAMGRWIVMGGIAGSVLLAGFSYLSFLNETIWWRHWMLTSQFNWTYTTNRPVATLDPVTQQYTNPARAFYDSALHTIYGPAREPALAVSVSPTPFGYRVAQDSLSKPDLLDGGAYVLARSAKRTYLFPVWQNQQSLLSARLLPGRLFTAGFKADVWHSSLAGGTYELFILTVADDGQTFALHPTNQTITSANKPTDTTKKNW